jgi:hypothetical protein
LRSFDGIPVLDPGILRSGLRRGGRVPAALRTTNVPAKYLPIVAGDYIDARYDASYAHRRVGPTSV